MGHSVNRTSWIGRIVESWRNGVRPSTKTALAEHPELREQDSVVLSLIVAEYKVRLSQGEALAVTKFCEQFSTFRDELRKILDVENGLAAHERSASWPEIGDSFLEFQLLDLLGTGAASRVYLASQPKLGNRRVALKVTPFESGEAETLGKLQHRNIVQIYSVHNDSDSKLTAVCMPYVGSATLQDVRTLGFPAGGSSKLPRSARLILDAAGKGNSTPPNETRPPRVFAEGSYFEGIAHVGAELAEGLAYTHSHEILHRDLKPSNVLITPDGRPMLLDFNLAWDAQRESKRLGGTLPYMPPEQIYTTFLSEEDEAPTDDPRADVYSLGVVLYELLTGELPFRPVGDTSEEWVESLAFAKLRGAPPLRQRQPAIPERLADVVDSCLAVDLVERPQSAEELARALRRFGLRRQFRGEASTRTPRWILAASLGGCLAVGSTAALWPDQRPPASAASLADLSPQALIERGEFALAAHQLKAIDAQRSDWMIKAQLAYCHFRLDNIGVARSFLDQALTLRPNDPDLLCNLAYCHLLNGAATSAVVYLDRVIAIDPRHALALQLRAVCNLHSTSEKLDADGGCEWIRLAVENSRQPNARLYLDAAHVVTRARMSGRISDEEARPLLKKYLQTAVSLGLSRTLLENQPFQLVAQDDAWWQQVLKTAATQKQEAIETNVRPYYVVPALQRPANTFASL